MFQFASIRQLQGRSLPLVVVQRNCSTHKYGSALLLTLDDIQVYLLPRYCYATCSRSPFAQ